MRIVISAVAAVTLAGVTAGAQPSPPLTPGESAPQFIAPQSPPAATGSLPNAMTRDFLTQAAANDQFSIEIGGLAVDRAEDELVRQVARKIVADRNEAARKLRDAAQKARMPAPVAQLTAEQRGMLNDLQKLGGAAFDRAYIAAQQKAQAIAIKIFETYAQSGESADMIVFAKTTLPILQAHKEAVDKLADSRA